MSEVLKIFLSLLIYIINIKLCLNNFTSDSCTGEMKYSTFSMNCSNPGLLTPNLTCPQNQKLREDGVKCMNNPTSEPNSQRNFYGVYFENFKARKESKYNNVLTTDIKTFRDKLNGMTCENERLIICQQLINDCILNIYDNKENEYCKYINEFGDDNSIKNVLNSTKLDDDLITVTYTLDEDNNSDNQKLNFWVAKFGANGTLIKFERLEYDFLQCNNSNHGKTKYRYYGNNFESTCHIDINKYLNNEANFFYEIFLENNNEGDKEHFNLIKIPIRITNKDNMQVYRMFLHYYDSSKSYFTYASKVKLYVQTKSPKEEYKIKYPYFEVTYDRLSNIGDRNKNYIEYTFISEYKSDITKFVNAMKTVFWILTAIVILLVLYRTFVWIQYNPREVIPNNYLFK